MNPIGKTFTLNSPLNNKRTLLDGYGSGSESNTEVSCYFIDEIDTTPKKIKPDNLISPGIFNGFMVGTLVSSIIATTYPKEISCSVFSGSLMGVGIAYIGHNIFSYQRKENIKKNSQEVVSGFANSLVTGVILNTGVLYCINKELYPKITMNAHGFLGPMSLLLGIMITSSFYVKSESS